MRSALQREKWWLIANALAISLYLFLASKTWDMPDGIDLAFSRGLVDLPLFLCVAMVDLVWFAILVARLTTREQAWRSLVLLAFVPVAWAAACALDRSHWGVPDDQPVAYQASVEQRPAL